VKNNQETYRLLIAEDENSIAKTLKLNFELEGFEVHVESNGLAALKNAQEKFYDLIILDVMLPEMDGITICESLRLGGNHTPVLFLSAKGTGKDKVEGLKVGGDDYLAKPFEWEELLLRSKKLIVRKSDGHRTIEDLETFTIGPCTIHFNKYEVETPEGIHAITKREAMLLRLLISKQGEAVSREEILEKVWGYDTVTHNRTIDNFILNFRKIFESHPNADKRFLSIRGVGYKFL
jgi:two-component system alkaline phosphatase synthesis response regulator PhoP